MLNSVTRKDSFPIPNIVELLSYLRKSKFFTSLGLAQAFHSIPVCEIDREKLSFCALDKSLPVLSDAVWSNQCAKYLGKVSHESDGRNSKIQTHRFLWSLVHSPDLQTHLKTIKEVFMLLSRFGKAGLRINMEKIDWIKK